MTSCLADGHGGEVRVKAGLEVPPLLTCSRCTLSSTARSAKRHTRRSTRRLQLPGSFLCPPDSLAGLLCCLLGHELGKLSQII